eukprot:CAMPEP_0177165538 /NCGR_PEP_ID=MMETSP0367-20130122/7560_1 /TAXON_ID=447022 ORGANISM="Scrippsiella hangoei-like, Strain SHHI-4" /NCGR_SAMPLE_ID=MMETSP0367 /ASSEMBLY_ACC=CAM_ASM_000362 /LENGTH=94 /DNA_ID=CAMNT_0018611559 /DNA_START=247 /DNA_END=533 /DNA_ORIENTATION=+
MTPSNALRVEALEDLALELLVDAAVDMGTLREDVDGHGLPAEPVRIDVPCVIAGVSEAAAYFSTDAEGSEPVFKSFFVKSTAATEITGTPPCDT